MGQTNRNLAAKHAKAKSQKVDFVKAETSKAFNYVTVTDADRLTAAIAARSTTASVQGRDVRRVAMVSSDRTVTVTSGDDVIVRTTTATKSIGMRKYLRSMF